jgi:hypothetical protein
MSGDVLVYPSQNADVRYALPLLVFLVGCGLVEPEAITIRVEGRVTDVADDAQLDGARVTVGTTDFGWPSIQRVGTDAHGRNARVQRRGVRSGATACYILPYRPTHDTTKDARNRT